MLYLVTFVTHNSKISDRMITYCPVDFIKGLTPLVFLGNDYLKIIDLIHEGIQRYKIKTIVFTVIPDHVHLLVEVTDEKELNEQTRKLKGFTSFQFQRYKEWEKGTQHVWAQKFHRKKVQANSENIARVINYITNNTEKHNERWGNALDQGAKKLKELSVAKE